MKLFTTNSSYIFGTTSSEVIRQPILRTKTERKVKAVVRKKGIGSKIVSGIAMVGAVMFLLSSFTGGITSAAFADEDSDKKLVQDAGKEWLGEDVNDVGSMYDKMGEEGKEDLNGFAYLLDRVFSPGYINDVSDGASYQGRNPGTVCDVNDNFAGTPLYHNCAVPNLVGEFSQDVISMFSQTGMINAEITKNQVPMGFGLPSNMPKDGAPVNPDQRTDKYTGLELYGYNLKFQSYAGEWDHIKVNTAARAMANMGFFEAVGVTGKAIFTGIEAGLQAGTSQALQGWNDGDLWAVLSAPFAAFEGAVTGTIKSIMDSSDLNVIENYGWYRVNYGSRLYDARELSKDELAMLAKNSLSNMILGQQGINSAGVRPELSAIQAGPDDLKKDVSICTINGTKQGEGMTKPACEAIANAMQPKGTVEWSKDGASKGETLAEWNARNASIIEQGNANGMSIEVGTDEANKSSIVAGIRGSWAADWQKAVDSALDEDQNRISKDWLKNLLNPLSFTKHIAENKKDNFNAPWSRYVCTDQNGKDLKDGNGKNINVYDDAGNLNSMCKSIRPPVQDGIFGNGYTSSQTKPEIDTRNAGDFNPVSDFVRNANDNIANVIMNATMFFTQVSNTALNLAFSPIMEELGLTKVVVSLIEGFRDGIFYPLVLLMVGIAAIMALYQAGKNRTYGKQMISLLVMCGIFIMGVFLMHKPAETIKAIDTVPAMVEQAIVGMIFSTGNQTNDFLCTATGTVASGKKYEDLQGKTLQYTPDDGTRALMCENWRVFAFTPWVFGQWGTNFNNLYAADTNYDHKMKNTNTELVGNADVNMGAGITINNWAIYQLDKSSSGTASFVDTKVSNGSISRDMYRIVDMQAGPNNGELSDGRYLEAWSGDQTGLRITVAILSMISSIFGAVVVIMYSFTKLIIAFTTTVMLIFMPFFFLIGLHPTMGRGKLKQYVGTILGLMLQRVVLVLMLALMLRLLTSVALSTDNYFMSSFATIAICVIFMIYRKEILDLVFSAVANATGGAVGQNFLKNPGESIKEGFGQGGRPGYIANKMKTAQAAITGAAGGYIGGRISGQRGSDLFKSARETASERISQTHARQRSFGIGGIQSLEQGLQAGKSNADREYFNDRTRKAIYDAALDGKRKNQKEINQYKKDVAAWNNAAEQLKKELTAAGIKNPTVVFTDPDTNRQYYEDVRTGQRVFKPKEVIQDSARNSRKVKVATRKIAKEEERMRYVEEARQAESDYSEESAVIGGVPLVDERASNKSKADIIKEDHRQYSTEQLKEALKDLRGK